MVLCAASRMREWSTRSGAFFFVYTAAAYWPLGSRRHRSRCKLRLCRSCRGCVAAAAAYSYGRHGGPRDGSRPGSDTVSICGTRCVRAVILRGMQANSWLLADTPGCL